jgi:hypothetical protein
MRNFLIFPTNKMFIIDNGQVILSNRSNFVMFEKGDKKTPPLLPEEFM